jgi:hypothetical protein
MVEGKRNSQGIPEAVSVKLYLIIWMYDGLACTGSLKKCSLFFWMALGVVEAVWVAQEVLAGFLHLLPLILEAPREAPVYFLDLLLLAGPWAVVYLSDLYWLGVQVVAEVVWTYDSSAEPQL